jgi:hypothetical protein
VKRKQNGPSTFWPELRERYPDSHIFSAVETELFFRLAPERTLKFKGEKCVAGKLAKDRHTVLFCASSDGKEKRKFVIGKSKTPGYLKV